MNFIYSVIEFFKNPALYQQTQLSIQIDVIEVKKHVFLNFVEKYDDEEMKVKKMLQGSQYAMATQIFEYARRCHCRVLSICWVLHSQGF